VRKRPQPKVAAAKQKADEAETKSKPATSRSRSAVLLRTAETQQAALELLDQLGAAQQKQQLRQKLTSNELQQVERLTKLLQQLRTAPVVNQRISRTLTQTQWQQYCAAVNQPISSDELLRGDHMPSELLTYQSMIQQADKLNALAEAAYKRRQRSGNVKSHNKLRTQAEKIYEDACGWMEGELLKADTMTEMHMRAWLDREFDYSPNGKITIDCVGVARIHGSASQYCLTDRRDQKSQRRSHQHREQTAAVISALQQLLYEPQQETPQEHSSSNGNVSKLRQLLRNSSDDEF
jgi:hypothetical protein